MGFFVDLGSMTLLMQILPPLESRAVAFWCAASSTWWINRRLTFRRRQQKCWKQQWGQSVSSALLAFVPNMGVYAGLTLWWSQLESELLSPWQFLAPYLLMIPGIAVGMFVNYWLADRWVFANSR